MRNVNKTFLLFALTLVFTVVLADASFAGTSKSIMQIAADKAIVLFRHVKGIIFIVGGFGLVGIAFQAIFGKVKWSWFAGLAIGLGILAAAGAIVNYATGDQMGAQAGSSQSAKDTFTDGDTEGVYTQGSGSF